MTRRKLNDVDRFARWIRSLKGRQWCLRCEEPKRRHQKSWCQKLGCWLERLNVSDQDLVIYGEGAFFMTAAMTASYTIGECLYDDQLVRIVRRIRQESTELEPRCR